MHSTVLWSCLFAVADAHGGLVMPPPRNNYGNMDPMNYSYHPGQHYHWGGPCAGDMCLWFSEGCYIGCKNCSRVMPSGGNQGPASNVPDYCTPKEPTLPFRYRTWNIKNLSKQGDWTKYHPWRAPGRAPVSDPCGVAGAYAKPTGGGGETPVGAKQGDLGSKLPPLKNVYTWWTAGDVAEVAWMIGANHGGGYLYSVCPKDAELSEECFSNHTLQFVNTEHTIRWLDRARNDTKIPAIDVSEGTFPLGSAWRLNPIPSCNCDQGGACQLQYPNHEHLAYGNESHAECPICTTGLQFDAPVLGGCGQQMWDVMSGPSRDTFAIVDTLRVPSQPGEYVLRWRWDTEQNPQVWTHCADVSVLPAETLV